MLTFGFLRIKFQLPRLLLLPFLGSSPVGVAAGVEPLLSTDRPRCSVEPEWCSSSVMSPVGVVDSPVLRDDVNSALDFQESNLLLLAFLVILEMKVGLDAVAGVDSRLPAVPGSEEIPD